MINGFFGGQKIEKEIQLVKWGGGLEEDKYFIFFTSLKFVFKKATYGEKEKYSIQKSECPKNKEIWLYRSVKGINSGEQNGGKIFWKRGDKIWIPQGWNGQTSNQNETKNPAESAKKSKFS